MKIVRIIGALILSCIFNVTVAFCSSEMGATQESKSSKDALKNISLNAMYNYNNFKFNSNTSESYNTYQGHTNLYLIGGHHAELRKNLSGGIYLYNAQTQVTSDVLLAPTSLVETRQSIQSNNIVAQVVQQVKPSWYLELMGGYGQNTMKYQTVIAPNSSSPLSSDAKSKGNNWFTAVTGKYMHNWKHVVAKTEVGLLFAEINQGAFSYFFSPNTPSLVPTLTNKSTYLLEHVELTYNAYEKIQPFISGGLLQVLQFSNSRAIIDNSILVGSAPEFNLNQNGFRVGAGFSFIYKRMTLRLEQQYDQRGTVFHTNQSILGLTLKL